MPNMRVPGYFYVNEHLRSLVFEELQAYCSRGDVGGFLPAVKQIANVAALPGIVKVLRLLPTRTTSGPANTELAAGCAEVHRAAGHALGLRLRHRQRGRLRHGRPRGRRVTWRGGL